MALPLELETIFRSRQKSYKMVLILSIIDEYAAFNNKVFEIDQVAARFLAYYQNSIAENKKTDAPPSRVASSWNNFSLAQTKALLKTPIDALSSILESTSSSITFKSEIWNLLNDNVIKELRDYAVAELEGYTSELDIRSEFSLQETLSHILENYLNAKTQTFANHPVGSLFRQTVPNYLKTLPFLDENFKIQGSTGQGNWANIPWIAIIDKRITMSTQKGEYIVYLFAEDMSSVYLTLNQGVTIPTKERGKKEGYRYLQQKVEDMRAQLPLDGLLQDGNIQLTDSGIGKEYQLSTVAYVRYARGNIPDDEHLLSDLRNVMDNYRIYASSVKGNEQTSNPIFKYTMAYLYYGQGIIAYLGNNHTRSIPVEELISNQSIVLRSGDEVRHPKERIQHIGRALQELDQLTYDNGSYKLTSQGQAYFQAMDPNIWKLSFKQSLILRQYLMEPQYDNPTNLSKVINLAISIAQELSTFTFNQFNNEFISIMGMEEEWSRVTQDNRSRFMLNWLEELRYIIKSGEHYIFQLEEEVGPLETLTVTERIELIKAYIRSKGFFYPNTLIENLYLSFKTKPFVILAGVSGTGKTKLVKLFAEAIGATSDSHQFTLIPVRPDWSDSSDLLGYKDLKGAFRPGRLSEVLVEASQTENRNKPYFICLDEMNLARVEHYFSDLLSIIETQEWQDDRIITNPLIHRDSLQVEDQDKYGNLSLPDNVYILGTVNMDETTHPFSKKVLDRANTIEFNYINLDQYPDQQRSINEIRPIQAPNSFLRSDYLQLIDMYEGEQDLVKKTTEKLVKINSILEQIHSHVGFRIRDAVCFYMAYTKRFKLMSGDEAFDLQLLQKILPRVQGSSSSVKRVLLLLMQEALGKSVPIGENMDDASELYMKWVTSQPTDKAKHTQSARKIAFMLRRLEEDGFTSYWLS